MTSTTTTPCAGTTRPDDLKICDMSLRALPADVTPCRLPRLINTQDDLAAYHEYVRCRCDRPELHLCVSPLGVVIEIAFGSADHRVCSDVRSNGQYIYSCSPEIAAEALVRTGRYNDFEKLILTNKRAREHILSLPPESLHERFSEPLSTSEHIEHAKHLVRVAIAREAAQQALLEMIGGKA